MERDRKQEREIVVFPLFLDFDPDSSTLNPVDPVEMVFCFLSVFSVPSVVNRSCFGFSAGPSNPRLPAPLDP